jgi:transketolase N-terminal domain/subunit
MNVAPSRMPADPALNNECINTLRFLSVDAVQKADSGHPGMPMGAASMAYVLWTRFLKHNPANPGWFDRDRFVLSPGHGSMLLYSLLHTNNHSAADAAESAEESEKRDAITGSGVSRSRFVTAAVASIIAKTASPCSSLHMLP